MFSVRDYSIPKKLTWMNMLVSGTALLLAGAALFVYDVYVFRVSTVGDLAIQAQIIGTNSTSAVFFDDRGAAEKTLSALKVAPHVMSAEIYTTDGRPFAAYRRDRAQALPSPPRIPAGEDQVYRFQADQIALARLITFEGKPAATVYIRSDLGALYDRIRNFALIVGAVFLLALAAAMWMSASTRRSIADPIVSLAATAQIVLREKDYSVRAPANPERNEIAVLISTFNEMLAQIQARDAALGEAHDSLERQVQERTAQLNVANADLEAFSYSVSHDLRAPLRHIDGFSQILLEDYGSTMEAEAQQYLKRIRSGAVRMGQLIEDLLKMAQIGRKELACIETDLNSLLQDVRADLQAESAGRQIEWRIGELPSVECDPGLIKQVFANLVSNAVKYTRRRELAIIEVGQAIDVGQSSEREGFIIFVRDNGAGFDERYADKLFGVFQRLHRAEEFEGTGVGLSTVRRIVKKHGGEIWAKSKVDEGATFFFTLAAKNRTPASTKAVAIGQ